MSQRGNWKNYYQSYFYITDKYKHKIPSELIAALQKNVRLWVENYQKLLLDSNKKLADKDIHITNQEKIIADKAIHIANQEKIIADKDTHIANQEKFISKITNSLAYRLYNKVRHLLGKKNEQ